MTAITLEDTVFISGPEAAAILGCSLQTIHRRRETGALPGFVVAGSPTRNRLIRFRRADVVALLQPTSTAEPFAPLRGRGRGRPRKNLALAA